MSQFASQRPESAAHRLYDLAKTALIKIFVNPYATVLPLPPSLVNQSLLVLQMAQHLTLRPHFFVFFFFWGSVKVCELYCAGGLEAERWEEAQIGHYIGIGMAPTFP